MACSWVLVWIPTKTNIGAPATSITQKQRGRLFSSVSTTLSETGLEEVSPGSLDIPTSPTPKISRGDTFTNQTSTDDAFNTSKTFGSQNQLEDTPFRNVSMHFYVVNAGYFVVAQHTWPHRTVDRGHAPRVVARI